MHTIMDSANHFSFCICHEYSVKDKGSFHLGDKSSPPFASGPLPWAQIKNLTTPYDFACILFKLVLGASRVESTFVPKRDSVQQGRLGVKIIRILSSNPDFYSEWNLWLFSG